MKKLVTAILMWPLLVLAQSYPSPTYNNVTINGTATLPHAQVSGGSISSTPISGSTGSFTTVSSSGLAMLNGLTVTNAPTFSTPVPITSGGTGTTTATGTGSVVLATSPTITGTYTSPFSIGGISSIADTGRSNNDNTPTLNFTISEALNYTASYATHYGMILNATELAGGTGDRIGIGAIQTCNATLTGKSCVGAAALAVAGGSAVGNYTGFNCRSLVPASLTGPSIAVGCEADVETHSPVAVRNALRVAGENLSGGTTTYGSTEDALITMLVDSGNIAEGFNIGILFEGTAQGVTNNWPIRAGGTILQAQSAPVTLLRGIDFSGTTFSDSAWKSTGFVVGPGGSVSHAQQEIDKSYVYTSPANGATLNFGAGAETILIDPAGALTSLTVTMIACNSTNDGFISRFSTTQGLTGLTVNATAGAVANAPTSMSAGQGHAFLCDGSRTAWYPLY